MAGARYEASATVSAAGLSGGGAALGRNLGDFIIAPWIPRRA